MQFTPLDNTLSKHYEPPSLAQVPVVWRNPFPDGIKVGDQHLSGEQTQEVIFNYFREVAPGVFADAKGGREPLRLTDIDGLLTSVGSAEPTSRFTKAAIEMSGASEREFSNLVLGDMAGVLLGRPGASIEKLKKLQSGWIGLSESDVVKTAHRGRAEGCFGTLVIAKEPSKAEVMIEVVRLGLCNRAMISATLADRLVAMLR